MANNNKGIIKEYLKLIVKNPKITNAEAAELLGTTTRMASIYRCRLRQKGYIYYTDSSAAIQVLKTPPTTEEIDETASRAEVAVYRADTIQLMIEKFMDDFENAERYKDRIEIGREIRLLLEML